MGYTYSFMDNAEYTASDVNTALSQFVTAGIEDPFEDGVPYNATKLNDIVYAVSSAGVVPSTDTSCKCSIDTGNKTVHIAQGTAFFADGRRITFDAAGETLEYTEGVKQYVYLKSTPSENRCYPICSVEQPSGDAVILAEIGADATLTDKRVYARGKLPGYQSNVDTVMHVNDSIVLNVTSEGGSNYGPEEYVIYLGTNNYKKLLYQSQFNLAIYDIETGMVFGFYYDGSSSRMMSSGSAMYTQIEETYGSGSKRGIISFAKDGTNLILTVSGYNSWSDRQKTLTVPIIFTLF